MIVTCPHCQTNYAVDDACIPTTGRSVRCAACAESWYVPSPVPIEMLTPLDPDAHSGRPRQFGKSLSGGSLAGGRRRDFQTQEFQPSHQHGPRFDGTTALAYLNDSEPVSDIHENDFATEQDLSPAPDIEEADWEQIEAEVQAIRQAEERATNSPFHRELQALEDALTERGPASALESEPQHGAKTGTAIVPHDPNAARQAEELQALAQDAGSAFTTLGDVLTRSAQIAMKSIAAIKIPVISLPEIKLGQAAEKTKEPENPSPFVYTPGDDAVDNFREQTRRQARRRLTPIKALGWMVWAGVFVGMLAGAYIFRGQIMEFAPGSQRAFAALGLYQPEIYPVKIISTQHRYAMSSGGPVIELRGAIRHEGETPLAAPMLRAEAYDARNVLLAAWEFAPQSRQLQPMMETPFLSRAPAPEGVARVKLTLVPPDNMALPVSAEERQQFFMESMTGGWSGNNEPAPIALEPKPTTE
jgi:predicted Zn finger-like uncharacterized protein